MKNKLKQAYEQMTGHDLPEGLKLGLVIVPHDEVVQDPEVGDMTRPESPIPIQDIPGPADQKGVFNDLLAETAMRENGQPIQDKLGPLREGLGGVLRLTKEEIFCFISRGGCHIGRRATLLSFWLDFRIVFRAFDCTLPAMANTIYEMMFTWVSLVLD